MTEAAMDPLQHFELPTLDIPIDFDGWLVGRLDNGGGDRLRWAVLELYRWQPRDGGPLGYILYTIGHSVVYHTLDSGCGRGVVTEVGSIEDVTPEPYDELTACIECEPPDLDEMELSEQVEMEKTWYKWVKCADAEELLLALRKEARCLHCFHRPHVRHHCPTCGCETYEEAPRPISSPGVRLLAQVKGQLPDVMEAMAGKKIRLLCSSPSSAAHRRDSPTMSCLGVPLKQETRPRRAGTTWNQTGHLGPTLFRTATTTRHPLSQRSTAARSSGPSGTSRRP